MFVQNIYYVVLCSYILELLGKVKITQTTSSQVVELIEKVCTFLVASKFVLRARLQRYSFSRRPSLTVRYYIKKLVWDSSFSNTQNR